MIQVAGLTPETTVALSLPLPTADQIVVRRQTDGWAPVLADGPCHSFWASCCAARADLLDAVFETQCPRLERTDDGRLIRVTPLKDSVPPAAIIQLCSGSPDVLTGLVHQTVRHAWRREQILERSEEVARLLAPPDRPSSSMASEERELAWRRRLACPVPPDSDGRHTDKSVDIILPELCELLDAMTVAFVQEQSSTAKAISGPVFVQAGSQSLSRQFCLELVGDLARQGAAIPNIINHRPSRVPHDGTAHVRSCAVVPVSGPQGRLGWLIATNREFGPSDVRLMDATAAFLASLIHNDSLMEEKELLLRGLIRSLINAIDAKDPYTCGHSDRVAEVARLIARSLSLDPTACEQVYMTGLLHDVGKISVPDEILRKPDHLTPAEFALIRQHPVMGYEMLKHLENLRYVLPGVLYHHEAVDGSGYPHGLKGDEIPLVARILAVADAWDAMTTNRPYRRGLAFSVAEQRLRDGIDRQWDARCVDAFFRCQHGVRLITSQSFGKRARTP